ncbi:DNA replication protein psf2 [Sporothrix epigloea]|uniref:DNA replication complex GINS protein PSF2 n=1 Tax=Sporothrix epigloea TaxID=1892477 RepID=A0ABP0E3K5_9PEZI
MASLLPPGLLPAEVAFVCEMEHVTVVPRQRLDSIPLLGGATPVLRPPHRAVLPLWLALLLKRQRRASIIAPPWLHPASLRELVVHETKNPTFDDPSAERTGDSQMNGNDDDDDDDDENGDSGGPTRIHFAPPPPPPTRADSAGNARRVNDFHSGQAPSGMAGNPMFGPQIALSAPFLPSCTAEAPAGFLPYHWYEVAEILLAHAPDDLPAPVGEVRALLRDLAEARAAKVRHLASVVAANTDLSTTTAAEVIGTQKKPAPAIVSLRGIGAMELAEARGLVTAVHDGVRRLGAAAEASRRDEEDLMGGAGGGASAGAGNYDDNDDDYEDMI